MWIVSSDIDKYREAAGLAPQVEDTLEISKNMRASSPPANALLDGEVERRNVRPLRRVSFFF